MECQCLVEKVDQNQEMADEGARKEDTMRALHQQFSNLNMEVARMKSSLDELEAACKWVVQRGVVEDHRLVVRNQVNRLLL